MNGIVDIVPGHCLGVNYAFDRPLPLYNVQVSSLKMAFYYIYLQHHGLPDVAATLLNHSVYKWQPQNILAWVKKYVPEPNFNFITKSDAIMRGIILHQIERADSPFREALARELRNFTSPRSVQFRVYTATNEMIFSSGLRFGDWKEPVPVFNLHSQHLSLAVDALCGIHVDNSWLNQHFSQLDTFYPAKTKSVPVVSDSNTGFISDIFGGDIIPVSGGRYIHAANALRSDNYNLASYRWIIVYIGTNERLKPGYSFTDRDNDWRVLKNILIQEANLRDDRIVMFSSVFNHPCIPQNASHAAFIERELRGTKVVCCNWLHTHNPFILPNGRIDHRYFVSRKNTVAHEREIHLNHNDLRLLWLKWCEYLPGLRCISYSLSPQRNTVAKRLFETVNSPIFGRNTETADQQLSSFPDTSNSAISSSYNSDALDVPDLRVTMPWTTAGHSEVTTKKSRFG